MPCTAILDVSMAGNAGFDTLGFYLSEEKLIKL